MYQFEVTTNCNLNCFYCPIETLKKEYMKFSIYCTLIDNIKSPSHLRLQGTGEPFLHPEFDKFLSYAKSHGHFIDIITNGTILISDKQLNYIDSLGFSIDTLDEIQAEKNGRKNLKIVLNTLKRVHRKSPNKCKVYSVSFGQDLNPLKEFLKKLNIPHIIQNLQVKTSYQVNYKLKKFTYQTFSCEYINQNKINYYFVDGTFAPCPYMINKNDVQTKEKIIESFSKKQIPKCCEQCSELLTKKNKKESLKISVIIPFYNTPINLFLECIDSVKKTNPYEIILVDDCSNDEKLIMIAKNSGCIYIKTPYQSGFDGLPFNLGVQEAKGDYICRVDSDDTLLELPTKMNAEIHLGNIDRVKIPDSFNIEELILAPRAIFNAMVIKKELLLKYKLAEDPNVFGDVLLVLRLLYNKHSISRNKKVNYLYRKREDSIQTSKPQFYHRLRQIQTVARFCQLENINPEQSIHYLELAMMNVKHGANSLYKYKSMRNKIT